MSASTQTTSSNAGRSAVSTPIPTKSSISAKRAYGTSGTFCEPGFGSPHSALGRDARDGPREEGSFRRLNAETMADQPGATTVPPIEIVMSEVVVNLVFVAHAHLDPSGDGEEAAPRLEDAEIAIDIAGRAYDRISARLPGDERAAIARMLTELRLAYVKKRGL